MEASEFYDMVRYKIHQAGGGMADETRYSMEGFAEHARTILHRFEQRRVEFLGKLKFRGIIACILLFTFPLWYSLLARWDYLGEGFSSVGLFIVHVLAAIVIIIGIVAFAVRPLFRYRYDTLKLGATVPGGSGVVQQAIDMKSQLFTQLLSYFGDFNMFSDRKLSLKSFRAAPNMPDFDDCTSEDYTRGQVGGVTVEMSEVELLAQRNSHVQNVFRGIFIILDINDPNVVLRGKFAGKTVAIFGRKSGSDFITSKYDGYKRVTLDSSVTQFVEAYTTDTPEAERLLTADIVRHIIKLSQAIGAAKNQKRSVDDKVAYALDRIAGGACDVMAVAASTLIHWFKTGSFKTLSQRHKPEKAEHTKADDAGAYNAYVQCAFYEDKFLLSIPCEQNLFEPDSVFYPPLTEEDIKLVYEMMTGIAGMAQSVVASLPKEMV